MDYTASNAEPEATLNHYAVGSNPTLSAKRPILSQTSAIPKK